MATYRAIADYVRAEHNFVPKTCWIAHVLSERGLTTRAAPNRQSPDARKHPCPDHRRASIECALRHFGMIAD